MQLHVATLSGDGEPLLLLHGFTGSSESWRAVAPRLPGRVVAVDLTGHGRSPAPSSIEPYKIDATVEAVLAATRGLGQAHLLGYSMGGRVALHLALAAPERFASLTLESASPGIVDAAERAARVRADEALADLLEQDGIEAFVDRWEQMPLFASQSRLSAAARARVRAGRLASDPRGLAGSLRGFGAGVPTPLQGRLGELLLPTLLIAGALDAKYVSLGQEMAAAMPMARLEVVADAGHTVHLEKPDAFASLVSRFIKEDSRAVRVA